MQIQVYAGESLVIVVLVVIVFSSLIPNIAKGIVNIVKRKDEK